MTWNTDRRQSLPPDWPLRRQARLEEDGHRCTVTLADGTRCRHRATDVHHIGHGDDHRHEMLRSICDWHHKRETSRQGNTARKRVTQRRPSEKHPGIIE